jgi:SulP family sulfate permease
MERSSSSNSSAQPYQFPIQIAEIRITPLVWLPKYTKETLLKDCIAGLTVFIFLVPQGMAYSILAGMPAVYGLYTATVPLFIYALFGTSHQLAIGPMAITSLLLGVTGQSYGYEEASDDYILLIKSITFLVGSISFFLGLFRLGSLSNVISQSVLTGFLTASALVIALSQFKYLLGIKVPRFDYSHQTIIYICAHLPDTNWAAALVGFFSLFVLYLVREWKKRNKKPPTTTDCFSKYLYWTLNVLVILSNFLIIMFGALLAAILTQNHIPIPIVGDVPMGFKSPSFDLVGIPQLINLVPSALAIAFVAFAGNWAVALKYANTNHYKVDATQELIGTGLANMIGMVFNSFVAAGGLARSAVNAESGAQTQMAACITATCMIIALCTLTSFFYYIPMCVLAAIIEVSIISMIDFDSMVKAYHQDRRDCFVMVVTFLFTFFLGVTQGLFVGFCISIAMILKTTAFPHIVVLGKLPPPQLTPVTSPIPSPTPSAKQRTPLASSSRDGSGVGSTYRDIKRFPEAEQIPGYTIVRMDASLYFANCEFFKNFILSASKGKHHSTPDIPIHTVIIDASAWIDIDLAGTLSLFQLRDELQAGNNNVNLLIACAKGMIRDRLKDAQFINSDDKKFAFYMSIDDAMQGRRPRLSVTSTNFVDVRPNNNNDEKQTEEGIISTISNPLHFFLNRRNNNNGKSSNNSSNNVKSGGYEKLSSDSKKHQFAFNPMIADNIRTEKPFQSSDQYTSLPMKDSSSPLDELEYDEEKGHIATEEEEEMEENRKTLEN